MNIPDISRLESYLGIKFRQRGWLTQALTHRSYLNENKRAGPSNERLEFLGDSVLSLLVSRELFTRFPDIPEGELTSRRSALVRTETLASLAQKMHLEQFLLMSKGEEKSGGRQNSSLLANTFEAVLGAIYLDGGLAAAQTLIATQLLPLIEKVTKEEVLYDFKSKLQEEIQKETKISPTYRVLSEVGPDHSKIFTVGVFVGHRPLSQGTGKSKQQAEQEAARLALEGLNRIK